MLNETNIGAIRTEYDMGQLSEDELAGNPIDQFKKWFDEALEKQVMEPNAMTLSTVSTAGRPSSRVVLLKELSETGFGFYTNYQSRKGLELAGNSQAAVLFFWPELQRQVRIIGHVVKMSAERSDAYFQSRPRGSQLGATASPQSQEIADRSVLEDYLVAVQKHYVDAELVPRPTHWGGYWLIPEEVEFWQGRHSRLHDRLCYKVGEEGGWKVCRLAP